MQTAATRPSPAQTPGLNLAVLVARFSITLTLALVLVVAAAAAGYAYFRSAYKERIYPGVTAWGVDLSGMTLPQAALTLSNAFTYPQGEVFTFRDGDKTWTTSPAQLGVSFDLPATVAQAYTIGRGGDLGDLREQFEAWYYGRTVSPIVVYDPGRARAYLENLALEVDRPLVEATLGMNGGDVQVEVGQVGREMDVDAALTALTAPVTALAGADLPLVIHEFSPEILDPTAQADAARLILAEPLTLNIAAPAEGDPGPWVFDQQTLAGMLAIQRVHDSGGARYEVGLATADLGKFLTDLAPSLEREPKNARFIFNDDTKQLDLFEAAVIGRALDVPATIQSVNTLAPQGQHQIPLVFQETLPAVTDDMTGEQLGITELVSDQYTSFAGSIPERIQNIKAASKNFLGLLIAPGEQFSMVEHMDDVSLDNGYAEALIIFGGRTIKGVGGGVCQVSTTLFRAVVFGGYQIDERYSHAYRVGYYEHGFGPGLDATVFAPLVDFKFTNDSDHWLLIEVYVYQGEMEFKFYSTSDGREVQVSRPKIENVVLHPEDKYEENPDLAAGEIKKVDYAADGADVTVTRVVTRNGEVIHNDPIRTHYLPWQAVYQYGPGTVLPTPTAPAPQ